MDQNLLQLFAQMLQGQGANAGAQAGQPPTAFNRELLPNIARPGNPAMTVNPAQNTTDVPMNVPPPHAGGLPPGLDSMPALPPGLANRPQLPPGLANGGPGPAPLQPMPMPGVSGGKFPSVISGHPMPPQGGGAMPDPRQEQMKQMIQQFLAGRAAGNDFIAKNPGSQLYPDSDITGATNWKPKES
jgi:hypothetical protein